MFIKDLLLLLSFVVHVVAHQEAIPRYVCLYLILPILSSGAIVEHRSGELERCRWNRIRHKSAGRAHVFFRFERARLFDYFFPPKVVISVRRFYIVWNF